MNYPKNLNRAAIARRVVILVCVAFIFGVVVGGVSGYALKTHFVTQKIEREGATGLKQREPAEGR